MKRGKWKEAVLLLLPVVAIICVGLWWQQREKRGDLETGPLRLEIETIEKVTPTPVEVAEGYDTKFLVTFALRGRDPLSFYRRRGSINTSYATTDNLKVQVREKEQWRTLPTELVPPVRAVSREWPSEIKQNQVAFLLPLSQLPKADLRLQFIAESAVQYIVPTGSVRPQRNKLIVRPVASPKNSDGVTALVSSPTLSVMVRKAGDAVQIPEVSRESSLTLDSAKVIPFMPVELNRQGNPSGANRKVQFEVRSQEPGVWRRRLRWKMLNAHIVDENGKIYRKWLGWKMYSPTRVRQFHDFIPSQVNGSSEPDVFNFEYSFSTAFIPLSAGQLTFKAQVSMDGEWPLPLSVVVRKKDDWTLKRSRTLKLKSIETKIAPDDQARIDVTVKIGYSGKKQIIAATREGRSFDFSDMYQSKDAPPDDAMPEIYGEKRGPHNRFLVSSWSHRIENALSPIPSPALQRANSGYYPVRVYSVSSIEGGWEIIYRITSLRLKKLPAPLVFKADIGVEGDGFLPVSTPLSPALVAKTAAAPLP